MEDPKIKPRICVEDGCFNHVADRTKNKCPGHLYKELVAKKMEKGRNHFQQKYGKKKQPTQSPARPPSAKKMYLDEILRLQKIAHRLWSQIIRTMHSEGYVTRCCTCGRPKVTFGNGFFGIHAGHYYEKGKYFYFAYDFFNGGPQCLNCNNSQAGEQIEMRKWLVATHGKEVIENLEARVEQNQLDINEGRLPRVPSVEWYKDLIKILKSTTIIPK